MSNLAAVSRDKAVQFVESVRTELQSHLPDDIGYERLRSAFIWAVGNDPDILKCTPDSLINALASCVRDGLVPDGREGILIPFRNRDTRHFEANYIALPTGVIKRLKEKGGVTSVILDVVHENDAFDYAMGDNPRIDHRPSPLGSDRGAIIGAYCIFKMQDGDTLREVMDSAALEQAQKQSKAPNSPAWRDWRSEMCKKTVLKRAAKRIPSASELVVSLSQEDIPYREVRRMSRPVDTNPLIETPAQPALEHHEDTTPDQKGTSAEEASEVSNPCYTQQDYEAFAAALLRAKAKETIDAARKEHWSKVEGRSDGPTDAERRLEDSIYRLHIDRVSGKFTAQQCKAQCAQKIAEFFA